MQEVLALHRELPFQPPVDERNLLSHLDSKEVEKEQQFRCNSSKH
jgi:hypothetical protein